MLTEALKSVLILVEYIVGKEPYYPLSSLYTEELERLCELELLEKTVMGYVITEAGYTEIYKETDREAD